MKMKQKEDEAKGHPSSYNNAKKIKSLALLTHGCLGASLSD